MRKMMFVLLLFALAVAAHAQGKFYAKNASVNFSAGTPLENIDAQCNSGVVVMDAQTGRIECSVLIKSFQFERALMQEHFNENYMESSTYPKATFKGMITNMSDVNFSKDGTYKVHLKGTMDMHGTQRELSTDGILTIAGGKATKANSDFIVTVADYNIKIPSLVADKIAKEAKITVNADLQALPGK